ncbi:HvfC/BufC N-terminal domain-containing protein [Cupriavidus plantarum]|uniref:HvfC/BufC N-terminal domain-containing protein n=1 Tax=Cupriavidus plantarum TaxID=942865 RepID=UPI000F157146|nr:DNA-binding domain-containing protein [Cupriavidus plantarum]RLK33559.1 hypothetical protein C7417_4208 [Cupriavidus plantarum]
MRSPDAQQRLFARAIVASRLDTGIASACLSIFTGEEDAIRRRLAYYRGNQQATALSVLGNAYPVVRALLGNEFFEALSDVYRRAHPSDDPDLHRFGGAFSDFLRAFEPVAPYPYVPEVARLEWLCHGAYYARDDTPLTVADLAALSPDTVASMPVALTACTRPFTSPWDAVTIWRAHQPGGPALPEDPQTTSAGIVVRPGWRVNVLPASPAEAVALASLASSAVDNPTALGALLQRAATLDRQFQPAEALSRWLHAGMLRHVS